MQRKKCVVVMRFSVCSWLLVVACAACSPRYEIAEMPAPVRPPVNVVTPGLVEKEPDTCGAAGLQGLVGQPSGMIRTVRVKGLVRIIGPGELVSQEYNAHRVDVHTDANGLIRQVSCG